MKNGNTLQASMAKRKEMKERRSGPEGGHKHQWKYVNILSFLEPYVQERVTVSNFDQPSQTAESILNAMCENNEVDSMRLS